MSALAYKTTVSVPAASRDLTLAATVKAELGLATGEHNQLISTLIRQASQACASYCNREFAQETLVAYYRLDSEPPHDAASLLLPRVPVASVASAVEDGVALAGADYEFEAATGFLWRLDGSDNRSCWASAKIAVTFVAGYELLDQLPHDIERAAILMVKQAFYARTRDPLVKSEEVPGVLSTAYWVGDVGGSGTLPPDVTALLDPYRMPSI